MSNISTSYREINVSPRRSGGLTNIQSIAYNGTCWIITGRESLRSTVLSTYPGVMSSLGEYYRIASMAMNSLRSNDISRFNFEKNTAESYLAMAEKEFSSQQSFSKATTSYTFRTTHTMAISFNGKDWTLIQNNPFAYNQYIPANKVDTYTTNDPPVCNGIAWNGSMWVAVGSMGGKLGFQTPSLWSGSDWVSISTTYPTSEVATSVDGINWYKRGRAGLFSQTCHCVAASPSLWVVGGDEFINNINSGGYGCISTSTNGITWTPVQTPTGPVYGVAYNGTTWVAVGKDGSGLSGNRLYNLATSTDGSTWTGRVLGSSQNPVIYKGVAWNGNKWMAVGGKSSSPAFGVNTLGIISTSDDGLSWTHQDFDEYLTSVCWNGVRWIIGGEGIFTSSDGENWSNIVDTSNYINTIAAKIILPITGGLPTNISSIIATNEEPLKFLISEDEQNWKPLSPFYKERPTLNKIVKIKTIIYDGSKWLTTGQNLYGNNLFKSTDGLDWTNHNTGSTIDSGKAIAYNGNLYVCLLETQNRLLNDIATSPNSTTWTKRSSKLQSVSCIAHNTTTWVIGGSGIQYSTNGTSWTKSTVCPLTTVNTIAWNGYMWLAGGVGSPECIAASTDGIRWYSTNVNKYISTCKSISWNKNTWVAVGKGDVNNILTSVDGVNWTANSTMLYSDGPEISIWDGSKFLVYGEGPTGYITSIDDGNTWQAGNDVTIESITAFSKKTLQLPITGTNSNTILTKVNEGVAAINVLRNQTIAEEEAAQKFLEDQAAQAADAALKASKISSATTKRTAVSNWKTKVENDWTPLTSKTYIDLSSQYPTEYAISLDIYEQIQEFYREVEIYYTRINESGQSTSVIVEFEGYIDTRLTNITSLLLEFYNKIRVLYSHLFDSGYAYAIDTSTTTIIENFGFSNTTKQRVLTFFNLKKAALLSLINTAKTNTLNVAVTSTSSIPNFKALYDSILYVPPSYSLSNTFETDSSDPFLFLRFLRIRYAQIKETKDICDGLYQDAIEYGQNWLNISSEQFDTTQLDADFNELYAKYFWDIDTILTPKFYNAKFPKLFFEYEAIRYKSIVKYPSVMTYITTQINAKQQEIDADIRATGAYVRTKLQTTVTGYANEYNATFFQYNRFGIYGNLNIVQFARRINDYSGRNSSVYKKLARLAFELDSLTIQNRGVAIHDAILGVKIADAEAEEDGAIPPKTGWGGKTNGLAQGDYGSPGLSGWEKFNETYYARERLAVALGNVAGTDSRLQFILDLIQNADPTTISSELTQLITKANEYIANNEFSEEYVDGLLDLDYNNSNSIIANYYRSTTIPAIQALKSSIQVIIPTQQDLTKFGTVVVPGSSLTLSEYVSNINSALSQIDTFIATNVSGYTIQQCKTLMESAKSLRTSLTIAQTFSGYTTLIRRIQEYNNKYPEFLALVTKFEKRVQRWIHLYRKALSEPPYPVVVEDTDSGRDFIISVPPTNEYFWTQRNASVVRSIDGSTFLEAQFDSNTNKYTIYNPIDIADYDAYSSSRNYVVGDRAVYQSKIYECIKDSTPVDSDGIIGIEPGKDTSKWKTLEYPIVTFLDKEIEARPENFLRLSSVNFLAYNSSTNYKFLDYVSQNSKVYLCYQDFSNYPKLKNILPTNTGYWLEVTYPILEYADSFNGGVVEASPTKLASLDSSKFEPYNPLKRYFEKDAVSFTSNNVTKVYECIFQSSNGIINVSPTTLTHWVEREYPSVFVNGVRTYITNPQSFPIQPLNLADISAYDASVEYDNGAYVKYNNKIYYSTIGTTTITNIPLTNTNYWKEVQFPHVMYKGTLREITPLTIPKLDPTDFEEYNPVLTYKFGDKVSYNNAVYECYDSSSVKRPIRNILPTNKTHWKERAYEDVITLEGEVIEANPANFNELNELDFPEYDNNWMYNVGDFVSYNSLIYQCINVSPSLSHTSNITGIPPTNSDYWDEEITSTLESFGIFPWNSLLRYSVGTVVTYENEIFICEATTIGEIPSVNRLSWSVANLEAVFTDYDEYDNSASYSYGNRVFVRTPDTTDIKFYTCYSTSNNELRLYEYDTAFVSSELDADGFNKYVISKKTWDKKDVPRYGLGSTTDPFAMLGFAREARRKCAMFVELPFHGVEQYLFEIDRWKLDLATLSPITNDTTTASLINRINVAENMFITTDPKIKDVLLADLISSAMKHVYGNISESLLELTDIIIAEQRAINDLKTSYFNNPFIQKLIYDNPYEYLNYVAESQTPSVRQFRDLGVGDIEEMKREVRIDRNQTRYTEASIAMTEEKIKIIESHEQNIADAMMQAKQLIGYNMLFQMKNSTSKMGAAFYTDLSGRRRIGAPIYDYQGNSDTVQDYRSSLYPILGQINIMMEESIRPPDYVMDRSLASALTWESQNPAIQALGRVAKGLVGLVAAAAENFTSPQGLFDILELGAKIATWDFDNRVLTVLPEYKYPTFKELSENRVNYKRLVKYQRQFNDGQAEDEDEEIRIGVIITQLAFYLDMAKEDLSGARAPISLPSTPPKTVTVPVSTVDPPVIATPNPKVIPPAIPDPVPPVPPTKFTPIPPPRKPLLIQDTCTNLLKQEIDTLQSELIKAQSRLRVIKKLPMPPPVETNIVDVVRNDPTVNQSTTRRFKHQITSNTTFIRTSGNLQTTGKAGLVQQSFVPRQQPAPRIASVKPDATVLDRMEDMRRYNEELLAVLEDEKANALARAEIEKIEKQLTSTKGQLSLVEAENAANQAANKQRMDVYRNQLEDAVQKNIEGRRQAALDKIEYEKAVAENKAILDKRDLEKQIQLEQKRAKWIDSRNKLTASRELVQTRKAEFAAQILEDTEFRGLINTKLALSIRAKYASVINSIASTSTAKTIVSAYRRSYTRLASSAVGRKFGSFYNAPKVKAFRKVCLGPITELAGIGVTAWQNGAFSGDEEV